MAPNILPNFFYELDKHLKTPNRNRLLIFLKILTNTYLYIIENKNTEYFMHIPKILTRNFITQLLGYFRTFKGNMKDKEYHEAVRRFFETLLIALKMENVNSDTKILVLKKLLFDPGTFVFEKVTKSKIIQQITQSLDPEGVEHLALIYKGVIDGTEKFNSENDSETWVNNDRLYSAHLLIKLLNLPNMKQQNEWKVGQLNFLMSISLLRETSGHNIGRELAESLKVAFFGALDLKFSKLEELQSSLSQLVKNLDSKLTSENLEAIMRNPIATETYELWKETLSVIHKIEKKKKKSGISSIFLTLFLHMSLQLFNDVKLATDSLKELFSCYERVKKDKKYKRALHNTTIIQDTVIVESENDPLWIEVVIDLFLNLLSQNSHLLRSIIKSVFPHLCQYMNSTTIHQIISVFDPKQEGNPLSRNDETSSESENDHSDSDLEEYEDPEAEDDLEAENEDSDEENLEEDEKANDKLRIALHQVLSKGQLHSDEESIDLDQISDSEGERLDKALADAFREFKPNHGRRKNQTKDQETLTHFRIRVLDLVEIYLDSKPSMFLALEIMLPLLQSVEFSIRDEHQTPLNIRLRIILKKLLSLKNFSDSEEVDDKILVELLKSLLDKSGKNSLIVQDMGEQISDCCIFVVKCSEMLKSIEGTPKKIKKNLKSSILEVLSNELCQFVNKRDCLTPYVLFKQLLQLPWEGNIALAIILLDFMFDQAIRQFKKNQVAELLKIFYTNQRFFSQNLEKIQVKMLEAHKKLANNVVEFFQSLCDEPDRKNVKERFICNFFSFLTALKQSPLETDSLSWAEIARSVREYRSYKTLSKDAKVAYNKLCRACGVSNIVQMKKNVTKLTSLMENEDTESKGLRGEKKEKKKHKKRNKEKLKMKKEAKLLRLESLSQGLCKVDFEKTDVTVRQSEESEDIEENKSEKIKEKKQTKKKRKEDMQIEVANELNGSVEGEIKNLKESSKKKRQITTIEDSNRLHYDFDTNLNVNLSSEVNTEPVRQQENNKKLKKRKQEQSGISEVSEIDSSVNGINFNIKRRFSERESLVKKKKKKISL